MDYERTNVTSIRINPDLCEKPKPLALNVITHTNHGYIISEEPSICTACALDTVSYPKP